MAPGGAHLSLYSGRVDSSYRASSSGDTATAVALSILSYSLDTAQMAPGGAHLSLTAVALIAVIAHLPAVTLLLLLPCQYCRTLMTPLRWHLVAHTYLLQQSHGTWWRTLISYSGRVDSSYRASSSGDTATAVALSILSYSLTPLRWHLVAHTYLLQRSR
ncbi:hypothetical protein J6590_058246 [Homalodisca vitripennis]|nr:hypothetical protein J6590_058246 [Homalodisca vitripennis]